MMQPAVDRAIARHEQMKAARGTWESHWSEIAELMIPRKGSFNTTWVPGTERRWNIYDSTGPWALEQFAAGLHGVLTPPDRPWFGLTLKGKADGDTDQPIKEWLGDVATAITSVINDPESGWTAAVFDAWLEVGAFGTAIIHAEEGPDENGPAVIFTSQPLHTCFIGEDRHGRVDTIYRAWAMPARQVADTWPKTASAEVRKKAEDDPTAKIKILHAVEPDPDGLGWISLYIERDAKQVLDNGNYPELPYLVARWVRGSGEVYARSPGMVALPDVRMINAMKRTVLRGAQKIVDPPLMVPDDDYITPIRTVPGALIIRRAGAEAIQPLQTGGNPGLGMDLMGRTREDILNAFNVELFRLSDGPAKTATEVLYRREERLRLLGPVVGRLQRELLGPLIDRVYNVLLRRGELPALPEEAKDAEEAGLDVKYSSPLAMAQKVSRTAGAEQVLGLIGNLAQMDPGVVDNLDVDQTLRIMADAQSAPPAMLRSLEEVAQMRQQRAEAQQQQQQQAQMAQMAQMAQAAPGQPPQQGGPQ